MSIQNGSSRSQLGSPLLLNLIKSLYKLHLSPDIGPLVMISVTFLSLTLQKSIHVIVDIHWWVAYICRHSFNTCTIASQIMLSVANYKRKKILQKIDDAPSLTHCQQKEQGRPMKTVGTLLANVRRLTDYWMLSVALMSQVFVVCNMGSTVTQNKMCWRTNNLDWWWFHIFQFLGLSYTWTLVDVWDWYQSINVHVATLS